MHDPSSPGTAKLLCSRAMVRWGLIGAGEIARVFSNGMRFSKTGRIVAVASRTPGRGEALAADFGIPRRYTSYEELLGDREVDAVYISTIHPHHARWSIAAARAGKHILVEKPIGMNAREASAMIGEARAHGVFLMEAFMYRCHPQMRRAVELLREGAIGKLHAIQAMFGFEAAYRADSRLFDKDLGGGGILDIGCYPASVSRLFAGAALDKPFADPLRVRAVGIIGESGVDCHTAAAVEFPGGVIAQLACAITCRLPAEVTAYGSKGWLSIPNPWLPSSPVRFARKPLPPDTPWPKERLLLGTEGKPEPREIVISSDRDLYAYEADEVAAHIADRQSPAVSWEDSLSNMRLLDLWRSEIGLRYPQD
jgi:predicted dehydrogenase